MSEVYESNYHIAQGEDVQGPYTLSMMLQLIEQGRARPEMLYSRDGADWVEGFDCPELFPATPGAESEAGWSATPPPPPAQPRSPGLHREGSQPRGRGRVEAHRGVAILTLGILGLLLCFICGIFAWSMGTTDLAKMRAGRMDRSGEELTSAGRILGIITVVLYVIVFLFGVAAAMLGTMSVSHSY